MTTQLALNLTPGDFIPPEILSIVSTRLIERTGAGLDIVTTYRHTVLATDGTRWELVESWQHGIATVNDWRQV